MVCQPAERIWERIGSVSVVSATPLLRRSTVPPRAFIGLNVLATCEGVASTTSFCASSFGASRAGAITAPAHRRTAEKLKRSIARLYPSSPLNALQALEHCDSVT